MPLNWYVDSEEFIFKDGLKSLFFSGSPVPGGVGLWADPLGLAWLWGKVFSPAKPNAIKNAIYECGLESKGDAWMQFRSAYYLYAIIFLIFDVEAVFLLPFAVAFTGLGVAACLAMLVFVLMLIEGLAWAWAKGVLTWA